MSDYRKPRHWARPFEVTRLDEERAQDKGRNLTIRFNDEECALIERAKELLNTDLDGKAVKVLMEAGFNAMQSLLSPKTIAWIASQERTHKRARRAKVAVDALQAVADLQGIAENDGAAGPGQLNAQKV